MSNRRYMLNILLDLPENTPQIVKDYYINLPETVLTKDDSGVDIMVPIETLLNSQYIDVERAYGEVQHVKVCGDNLTKLDSGIKCCMFDTTTNKPVGYYTYGRSSIYKYSLSVANSVGIIDAGYRGHLIGMVYNMKFDNNIKIDAGTRLFQICAPDLSPLSVKIVDSLPDSARGEGGFGSTGK
jgi:dUTP pyrophosphatase